MILFLGLFMLTFAVIASLEWWLLRQYLTSLAWWIPMTSIGWLLYPILYFLIYDLFFHIDKIYIYIIEGIAFGLLMGFLRGLAVRQLVQAKRVIASSIIAGVLSHIFSLYIAFYLVRDQERLAQAGLLTQWFMFSLTVFYHTLNTGTLIWLLRDSSSPNQ